MNSIRARVSLSLKEREARPDLAADDPLPPIIYCTGVQQDIISASPLDAVTIPRVVTPATGALSASRLVFEGRVGVPAI